VEPNPQPAEGVDATFIEGWFDESFATPGPLDAVVHSHVFEHVYEPDRFVAKLAAVLAEGQPLLFSVPNMEEMLRRNYTNCLNFEHTVLLTEPYVEHLLSRHGFERTAKRYYRADHSIFYAYARRAAAPVVALPALRTHNRELFLSFVQ
jgi:2-polyprenyl-3-methyl-5-hydroxy-6-metoxy-1,4-benzoquinol methylase